VSTLAGLVLALVSTAALSYGFYRQHSAAGGLPALTLRHPGSSMAALLRSWRWLAGFVIGLLGWALYIVALRFAPLSLVQATSAGGVGLLALLVRRGGTRLSGHEWAGVAAAVGGLLLLGLSLPLAMPAARSGSAGSALPLAWVLASVVLAGAAAGLARWLRPGAGLGVAAGLLYSAGDVATKSLMTGTHPWPLFAALLLACHGLAFCCLQLAFQRGSALATAGLSTLLTNALPVIAGVTLYAEAIPAGAAGLLRTAGFAGTIAGAALLSARSGPVHAGEEEEQGERAGPGDDRRMPQPSLRRESKGELTVR
jgi:hypothetical protein